MRTSTLKLVAISALFIAFVAGMGHYSVFQGGYTGAPGEITCKTCHTIPTAGMSGGYMLQGLPANVAGGQTYQLTMLVYRNNNICETAGFQMNFLDGGGSSHGMLTEQDEYVEIAQFGGRTYAQSDVSPDFDTDDFGDTIYFPFEWTPEIVDQSTPITAYFGVAIGNGNYDSPGGQRGDSIYMGSQMVNVVPALSAEIMVLEQPACHGDENGSIQVTHSGGIPPIQVMWSTGDNGDMLGGVPAGIYSATVSDASGQQIVLNAEVTEPPLLTAEAEGTDPACHNTSDGIIDISPDGGTPPYLYTLDGAGVPSPIEGLGAGTYQYEVVDANGCSVGGEITLASPDSMMIELIEVFPEMTGEGGSILIEVSGGTMPYDFFWTGPNDYTGTTQNPNDLEAGNYSLTVTDANGCTNVFAATVDFVSSVRNIRSNTHLISLAPNPGNDLFTILLPEHLSGEWQVQCVSADGRKVLHTAMDGHSLTVHQRWDPGMYIVIATHTSGMIATAKWIRTAE